MHETDTEDLYGHTIFCDDIRFEVDGKTTLVGVYSQLLLVRTGFPVTLPKLCFAIFFAQKREIYTTKITVQIFLPGDSDDKPSIEADPQAPEKQPAPLYKFSGDYLAVRSNLVFAPFTLEEPGRIKVRMLREGVLHRLGTLLVISPNDLPSLEASSASRRPSGRSPPVAPGS
jgi:hypothetical protein